MIERPLYLQKLFSFRDKPVIKVITGIRRCGKSSILKTFAERLQQEGVASNRLIQINFEDLRYDNMDYQGLNKMLLDLLPPGDDKVYIFLDEIQRVPGWEKVANSLQLNPRIDLYLTGSNAYLLSSELSTYLSGRYVEIKMLPLSFKEFLTFYTFPENMPNPEKFSLYLRFGGMPSLMDYNFNETQSGEMLDSIYNTVLMKDIISRDTVKDVMVLQRTVRFLADNIGNMTSINKITNTLVDEKSLSFKNNKLVESYVSLLKNAFIFYQADRYDIKGKELLRSREKYYIVDSGLRTYLLGRVSDTGRLLENIVYFELLRRGYTVTVGKIDDKEVDFVATKMNDKKYVQVTETMAGEETRERELTPLRLIRDNFEKIVLTADVLFTGTTDDGIKIVNVVDWLLAD
nr:MAG TPA: putative ATPase (AAA+ superfamily) [Caudoviricetes sp.]